MGTNAHPAPLRPWLGGDCNGSGIVRPASRHRKGEWPPAGSSRSDDGVDP